MGMHPMDDSMLTLLCDNSGVDINSMSISTAITDWWTCLKQMFSKRTSLCTNPKLWRLVSAFVERCKKSCRQHAASFLNRGKINFSVFKNSPKWSSGSGIQRCMSPPTSLDLIAFLSLKSSLWKAFSLLLETIRFIY